MLKYLLCLLPALVAILPPPAHAAIFVSGSILTKGSQESVPGAVVSLYGADGKAVVVQPAPEDADPEEGALVEPAAITQSLPNGAFLLKAPAPGEYRLTVEQGAYLPYEQALTVPAAGIASLHLAISKILPIRLQVTGCDDKPVTQADVAVWMAARGRIRPIGDLSGAATASNGMFVFPVPPIRHGKLPDGMLLQVRAGAQGFGEVRIQEWPADPLSLHLQAGQTLSGQVTDIIGRPVPHTEVVASAILEDGGGPDAAMDPVAVNTDDNGNFKIPSLPPGSYLVRARIRGTGYRAREVTLSDKTQPITLTPKDEPYANFRQQRSGLFRLR